MFPIKQNGFSRFLAHSNVKCNASHVEFGRKCRNDILICMEKNINRLFKMKLLSYFPHKQKFSDSFYFPHSKTN